jgi:hypothetical protein
MKDNIMTETAAKTAKTAEAKAKAASRQNQPRPAYLLLTQPLPENFEIVRSTRKAEEALEAIDKGEAEAYVRIMIK